MAEDETGTIVRAACFIVMMPHVRLDESVVHNLYLRRLEGVDMKKFWAAGLIGMSVLLAGCGNSHEAGKSQFKNAIERYSKNSGVCLPLALNVSSQDVHDGHVVGRQIMLGMDRIVLETRNLHGDRLNETALKQMKILEDEGFYQKDKNSAENEAVFNITAKGQAQTRPGAHGPLFCIGKQRIENVLYYTEPATNAVGLTVSQVVYEADVNLESWADRLLSRGSADWKDSLHTRRTEQATMVKTNDGWRDLRELPRPDLPLPQ